MIWRKPDSAGKKIQWNINHKGRYTYGVHENCPIFKTPHASVHLRPNFFHPFDLGYPISDELPPLQMITNQLQENIIQGWLLYAIRSFLQVGFRFQYQPINFVWLSFHFFSFSLNSDIACPSSWLYTLVCAVFRQYQEMSFICIYSHF